MEGGVVLSGWTVDDSVDMIIYLLCVFSFPSFILCVD